MYQKEQDLINEAARRQSLSDMDLQDIAPKRPVLADVPLTREERQEIFEKQEARRAGINPVNS